MEKRATPLHSDKGSALNLGLRVVFAIFGAYGFSVLAGVAFARGGPFSSPLDAAAFSLMLGFILNVCAIVWVFAAATVSRAALGLLFPAMALAAWLHFSG